MRKAGKVTRAEVRDCDENYVLIRRKSDQERHPAQWDAARRHSATKSGARWDRERVRIIRSHLGEGMPAEACESTPLDGLPISDHDQAVFQLEFERDCLLHDGGPKLVAADRALWRHIQALLQACAEGSSPMPRTVARTLADTLAALLTSGIPRTWERAAGTRAKGQPKKIGVGWKGSAIDFAVWYVKAATEFTKPEQGLDFSGLGSWLSHATAAEARRHVAAAFASPKERRDHAEKKVAAWERQASLDVLQAWHLALMGSRTPKLAAAWFRKMLPKCGEVYRQRPNG